MTDIYMISEERLLDLLQKEHCLESLEHAGVDNWEGYGEIERDNWILDAESIDPGWNLGKGISADAEATIIMDTELGWDSICFASLCPEEAMKYAVSRGYNPDARRNSVRIHEQTIEAVWDGE